MFAILVWIMHCPVCSSKETRVIDSRTTHDGMAVRRRRECDACGYRFSTVEEMELLDITVVKRDGRREAYSRSKLQGGLRHSLAKRPYTEERFDKLTHSVERDIQKRKKRELTSEDIGEIVMRRLRGFDKVAYIRFASIYRAFEDVAKFQSEVKSLEDKRKSKK